jgi:hypothetical protein
VLAVDEICMLKATVVCDKVRRLCVQPALHDRVQNLLKCQVAVFLLLWDWRLFALCLEAFEPGQNLLILLHLVGFVSIINRLFGPALV